MSIFATDTTRATKYVSDNEVIDDCWVESRFPLQNTTKQVIFGWPLILKNHITQQLQMMQSASRARVRHIQTQYISGRPLLRSAFLLCGNRQEDT